MIQNTVLDQLPTNVKIVEQSGLPTQAFVFYLLKLFKKVNNGAGDLISLQTQIAELTKKQITVTSNYLVLADGNYTILGNATAGNISVTLPFPTRGKTVSVGKIDTSSNTVTILPHGTDLIAGAASQVLLHDGEVLDLIADDFNWYIGG